MRNLAMYDYGVLSNVGMNVHYICSKYYDYSHVSNNIIQHKIFAYNKITNPALKMFSYVWSYIRIFFLIIYLKPLLIHIQWFKVPYFDYYYYKLIKRLFGVKLIYTAHNILPHNTGVRYLNIFRKTYTLVDGIIVHSENTKKELSSLCCIPQEKIFVIPHGLLRMEYDDDMLKQNEVYYKKKYDIDGKIVFTSLGEQSPYKGIDLIADVWLNTPELRDNNRLKLLIVGKQKNVDLKELMQVENVVAINQQISNEEFIYLLHNSDVYLLPYRKISQSGALFTALAECTPVVVSDAGGLSEPISVAKVGWVIKADSKEALQHQLLYLSTHCDEIRDIKEDKTKWETIHDKYSWESISLQTAAIYSRFIS